MATSCTALNVYVAGSLAKCGVNRTQRSSKGRVFSAIEALSTARQPVHHSFNAKGYGINPAGCTQS